MVHKRKGQEGFALIATLMVFWVLTALGMLVFSVTTQDVRVSSRTVGEQKAFLASLSGLHYFIQNFSWNKRLDWCSQTQTTITVDTGSTGDPNTKFSIVMDNCNNRVAPVAVKGYAIAGGNQWGMHKFSLSITGMNTAYHSQVTNTTGTSWGPVEMSTVYR
jgi:Tfp pilus assembly protein PilX